MGRAEGEEGKWGKQEDVIVPSFPSISAKKIPVLHFNPPPFLNPGSRAAPPGKGNHGNPSSSGFTKFTAFYVRDLEGFGRFRSRGTPSAGGRSGEEKDPHQLWFLGMVIELPGETR